MSAATRRNLRVAVLVGFFVLSFAMYVAAESGSDIATGVLLGLIVVLMGAGVLSG